MSYYGGSSTALTGAPSTLTLEQVAHLQQDDLSPRYFKVAERPVARVSSQSSLVGLEHKRYNHVTWPMAHDCQANVPLSGESLQIKNKVLKYHSVCQTHTVREQLVGGIRCFRVNAEKVGGIVRLCHGAAILETVVKALPGFTVQTVYEPLAQFLSEVMRFVQQRPEELITIMDEGHADVESMNLVFTQVFAGWLTPDRVCYTHPVGQVWPTIAELLQRGYRIVVFKRIVQSDSATSSGYFNAMWLGTLQNVWQSPWCLYDENDTRDAVLPTDKGAHGYTGNGVKESAIFLYNHMMYTDGFPYLSGPLRAIIGKASNDFDTADPSKSFLCVGPLLNYDVIKAWIKANQRPNMINVDFYQGINVQSNLLDLVRSMNNTAMINTAPVGTPQILCNHVAFVREKALKDGDDDPMTYVFTTQAGKIFTRLSHSSLMNNLFVEGFALASQAAVVSLATSRSLLLYIIGRDGCLWTARRVEGQWIALCRVPLTNDLSIPLVLAAESAPAVAVSADEKLAFIAVRDSMGNVICVTHPLTVTASEVDASPTANALISVVSTSPGNSKAKASVVVSKNTVAVFSTNNERELCVAVGTLSESDSDVVRIEWKPPKVLPGFITAPSVLVVKDVVQIIGRAADSFSIMSAVFDLTSLDWVGPVRTLALLLPNSKVLHLEGDVQLSTFGKDGYVIITRGHAPELSAPNIPAGSGLYYAHGQPTQLVTTTTTVSTTTITPSTSSTTASSPSSPSSSSLGTTSSASVSVTELPLGVAVWSSWTLLSPALVDPSFAYEPQSGAVIYTMQRVAFRSWIQPPPAPAPPQAAALYAASSALNYAAPATVY